MSIKVRVSAPEIAEICYSHWYLDRGWETREGAQAYCDKMNGGRIVYTVVE